ncbi:MAG: M20/M25/M40 family metallo-hydrolase [Myxococcales bacterium]|nr:M20/M25/M40 family metallo-hydrolase [Myxococcales bacterium]
MGPKRVTAVRVTLPPGATSDDPQLGDDAVRHLQALLRIDTTNPPGNETEAAEYVAALLSDAGLSPTLLGPTPSRQSVVTRLAGTGERPPLLLHGHLDVVTADAAAWKHPPFGGEIHDGYLWGRGAIDMKHMVVMSALVMARLRREGRRLARDLIFAAVADEEAGCDHGSKFLVDQHPDLVRAEYALGENGGFTIHLGGRAIYPVQIAEKGVVWMKLKARGTPGHGSLPRDDNATVRLAEAVARLGRTRLPQHLTASTARYLEALAATQGFPKSLLLGQLKRPSLSGWVLKMIPDRGIAMALAAGLSNTAVPTVLRAGDKTNVIPGEAEAEVDGRSLPGQSAADLVAEVRAVVGPDIEIQVIRDLPPVETEGPSPLWDAIVATLGARHPGAIAIPILMPGYTDAKHWSRLGARCYGFCPNRFPPDAPRFADMFHGHDERIHVEGLRWGVNVLHDLVLRFAA